MNLRWSTTDLRTRSILARAVTLASYGLVLAGLDRVLRRDLREYLMAACGFLLVAPGNRWSYALLSQDVSLNASNPAVDNMIDIFADDSSLSHLLDQANGQIASLLHISLQRVHLFLLSRAVGVRVYVA